MEPLVVDQFGAFVGKKSERLVVQKKGEALAEVPLLNLEQVLIVSEGVSVSSDLVYECSQRGVPITFLTRVLTRRSELAWPRAPGGKRPSELPF